MILPNFLIIGAAKAGTTALAHYLAQHPDVCMARPKEPHFFDYNYAKGLEHYSRSKWPHYNGEAFVGEATPCYVYLPFVVPRVARHFPHAKLLILLRNPVDRAYSAWWMNWSRGVESLSFEEAVAENLAELRRGRTFEGAQGERYWHRVYGSVCSGQIDQRCYLEPGYYAAHIQRWQKHFPKQNIHTLFMNDLYSSPQQTLNRVCDFLGIPAFDSPPAAIRRNVAMPRLARSVSIGLRRAGLKQASGCLPEKTRRLLKRVLSISGTRPPMPAGLRNRLTAHYQEANAQLMRLLDVDLSEWQR